MGVLLCSWFPSGFFYALRLFAFLKKYKWKADLSVSYLTKKEKMNELPAIGLNIEPKNSLAALQNKKWLIRIIVKYFISIKLVLVC